jgi:hypothetical protein
MEAALAGKCSVRAQQREVNFVEREINLEVYELTVASIEFV